MSRSDAPGKDARRVTPALQIAAAASVCATAMRGMQAGQPPRSAAFPLHHTRHRCFHHPL
ncbi:hypothetical protein FHR50_003234 [Xanthomonas arboricola]